MKIVCTLPNASLLISGVAFEQVPGVAGVVSTQDLPDDVAQGFLGIHGYAPLQPAASGEPKGAQAAGDGDATEGERGTADGGAGSEAGPPVGAEIPARPAAKTSPKAK